MAALCGSDGSCNVRMTNDPANTICTNNTQCAWVTPDDAGCLFGPSWNSSQCAALAANTTAWSQLLNCTTCGSSNNTVWGSVALTVCTSGQQYELIETHDTAYRYAIRCMSMQQPLCLSLSYCYAPDEDRYQLDCSTLPTMTDNWEVRTTAAPKIKTVNKRLKWRQTERDPAKRMEAGCQQPRPPQ